MLSTSWPGAALIGRKYSDEQPRDESGRWSDGDVPGAEQETQPRMNAQLRATLEDWVESADVVGDRTPLVKAINASRYDEDLYRGMRLDEAQIAFLKVGETVDLGVSSTSSDFDVALEFTDSNFYGAEEKVPVLMTFEGPKRGYVIPDSIEAEQEVLVRGRYEITAVERTPQERVMQVWVKQVADLEGVRDPTAIGFEPNSMERRRA